MFGFRAAAVHGGLLAEPDHDVVVQVSNGESWHDGFS